MTAGFTIVAMAFCVYGYQMIHPGGGWFVPPDIRQLSIPGMRLLHGQLGSVYSSDRYLYALPLAFPLVGIVGEISSLAHLPGAPNQMWFLLFGPYILAFGALALHAVRQFAWEVGVRRRLWLLQLATVVLVLVPEIEWGHLEDVLALVAIVHCLRALLRSDFTRAAVLASVAVSFKQWALMLVPLVVLAAPAGRRIRCAVWACALPSVLAAVFLAFNFTHASEAFFFPISQVSGFPGHPWLDGTWLGRFSSLANRTAAVLVAGAVTWRWRHRTTEPTSLLAASGIILVIRPLTETINYSYYWSPSLLLLALSLVTAARKTSIRDLAFPILAMVWTLPRSNPLTTASWWAGELLLLGTLTTFTARTTRNGRFEALARRRRPPAPATVESELSGAYR